MNEQKKAIEDFELMKKQAELKALSDLSLIQPLTDEQYDKMINLSKELNLIGEDWTI